MKPVEIIDGPPDSHLVIYAKNRPEYNPLPVIRFADGLVISRWQLSWRERIQVLFGSGIFVAKMTFHQPLQPIKVATTLKEAQ